MRCFLLMFTLLLNCGLPLKLLFSDFLPRISEPLLCSVSVLRSRITILLDAHQLLMLFVETLIYLENSVSLCHILLYLRYCVIC
jgi:hypothetical protein